MNVVLRSKENAYRGFRGLFGVDGEMEAEWFVIQTVLANLDQRLLGVFRTVDCQTVADRGVELIEVGDQFVHDERFDLYLGENNFILEVWSLTLFVSKGITCTREM